MKAILVSIVSGIWVAALVTGCSEANDSTNGDDYPTLDAGIDVAKLHDATAPIDVATVSHIDAPTTTTGDSGGRTTAVVDAAGGAVVLNEVSGKGTDYVELFNAGTATVDISGWGVTNAKDDDAGAPGMPKTAVVFPTGTALKAGEYALALGAPKDGGTPISPCPATVCVQATWNVSNTSGASVYLLNPAGNTVATEAFPKNLTASGQSWGRLPNGTGAFAINNQTPGVVNASP